MAPSSCTEPTTTSCCSRRMLSLSIRSELVRPMVPTPSATPERRTAKSSWTLLLLASMLVTWVDRLNIMLLISMTRSTRWTISFSRPSTTGDTLTWELRPESFGEGCPLRSDSRDLECKRFRGVEGKGWGDTVEGPASDTGVVSALGGGGTGNGNS